MSNTSQRPRIVIAGYGSWPTAKVNPCAQVVEHLNGYSWDHCDLRGYEIPVVSDELYKNLETIIEEVQPHAFIGLGVAVRYAAVKAELLGINKIDLPVPDAAGNLTRSKPIVAGAPLAYESTMPNDQIVKRLKAENIPAMRSYYAGTHLCNQMLFTCAHIAAEQRLDMQTGFLHLPQSAENIAPEMDRIEPGPSMPFTALVGAVTLAIDVIVEDFKNHAT